MSIVYDPLCALNQGALNLSPARGKLIANLEALVTSGLTGDGQLG